MKADCPYCGSTNGLCDWASDDILPPCRAKTLSRQTEFLKEGRRIFAALLGIEAGILAVLIYNLLNLPT